MVPIRGTGGPGDKMTVREVARRMDKPAERMGIFEILARSARIEAKVNIFSAQKGSDLTRELFGGKKVVGIQGFRTENEDLLVFELEGNELAVARFAKGSIIALEGLEKGKRTIVGFRADIAHRGIDLARSYMVGRDITYLVPDSLAGAKIFNLSGEVDELGLARAKTLTQFDLSWWTEDWLTAQFSDGSKLVIRADKDQLKALQRHRIGGTSVLIVGDPPSTLPKLPAGKIPLLPVLTRVQKK